jgi:hypothetical protein
MIYPSTPPTEPQMTLENLCVKTPAVSILMESLRQYGPMFVSEAKKRVGRKAFGQLVAGKEIIQRLSNHGDCVVLNALKHHSNLFGKGESTHQHLLKTSTLDHLLIMRDAVVNFSLPGDRLERISVATMIVTRGSQNTCLIVSCRGVTTERIRLRLIYLKAFTIHSVVVVAKQKRIRRYTGFEIPVTHHHWAPH